MFTCLVRMTDLEDKDYCESVISVFVDGLHEAVNRDEHLEKLDDLTF